MEKEIKEGSNLPQKIYEAKFHDLKSEDKLGLSSGSFTSYWTWHGYGTNIIRLNHPAINANSRVFVAVSEYSSDPAINRFIGDAWYTVHNIAPSNGYVLVRTEIGWNYPINIRFDVLIDP